MLLLIPVAIAKKEILTRGTIGEEINAFFLIDSKLKSYKLSTTTLSVDFVLKGKEFVYIIFNYANERWWYITKLDKIAVK